MALPRLAQGIQESMFGVLRHLSGRTRVCTIDVELQPGVIHFFARNPHLTTLHWAEKAKKEVKKLIKAGIIKRISANE